MIWESHLRADEEVEDSWRLAGQEYYEAAAVERDHYARPRGVSPKLIRGDASVEALKQRLFEGRPCQAQVSDEAGDVMKWAFSERQLPATFAFYNKCFDATEHFDDKATISREITVRSYRHQVALAGQSHEVMRVVAHGAAADGFIGRVLIAKDDCRPSRPPAPRRVTGSTCACTTTRPWRIVGARTRGCTLPLPSGPNRWCCVWTPMQPVSSSHSAMKWK